MASSPKKYSIAFKAKIALEAIKWQETTNEISSGYGVHATQITQWKKQALDELPEILPVPDLSEQRVLYTHYETSLILEEQLLRRKQRNHRKKR